MIISEYSLSILVTVAINLYSKSEELSSLVRVVRVLNNMDNSNGRFIHIVNDKNPFKFIIDANSLRALSDFVGQDVTLISEEGEIRIFSLLDMIFIV